MNDKPDPISELTWQHRAARVVQTANEFDIFNLLARRGLSAEQIARSCGTEATLTEKLLIACCAMGLLKKVGGKYTVTDLARTWLVSESPFYQGNIVAHSAACAEFWHNLPEATRVDKTKPVKSQNAHRNFILGMRDIAATGRADTLVEAVDLSGRRKLLDVGGGPGLYAIAFVKRYPQLQAVIFDTPETLKITREVLSRENLADRVTLQPGDWNTDDFGCDCDVVLLSNVLHGPASAAEKKLKKSFDAMPAGGLLIIQDFLLNEEKTGPLPAALFNLMRGAFSRTELFAIVEQAGFVNPAVVRELPQYGSAVVTAARP